jgi:hypothetical protein
VRVTRKDVQAIAEVFKLLDLWARESDARTQGDAQRQT